MALVSPQSTGRSQGLMLVRSNSEIDAQELRKIEEQERAEEAREQRVETELAGHIRSVWERAKRAKEPIERKMLNSLRQIEGRYDDQKAAEITAQGLPLIYMKITSVKCRAAKSWIRDVLMPAGDRPWSLRATPVPSLPPEVEQQVNQRVMSDAQQFMEMTGQPITPDMMQEVAQRFASKVKQQLEQAADLKIERMADVIEDQLSEGGWGRHFDDLISDVVDFPAGILKGPVMRRCKKLVWDEVGGNVTVAEEISPEVERVDPFRFYPAPGVVHPDDGDCIEVHDYSADELHDLIGLPGYDEDAIRLAIKECHGGLQSDWKRRSLRSELRSARGETGTNADDEDVIEALEYWGSVRGQKLLDWGKSPEEVPDAEASYDIMAVLCGRHVICVRFNPDPLGRKPYAKACFEDTPGSFWGNGVPDLIEDCQNVCNAASRSLVANMGIASGPQVAVNSASIPPGQDVTSIFPWKIWQLDFTKTGSSSRPPIDFYQPNPMTDALLKVFEHFSRLADEYSGIPAYTYGVGQGMSGAGRTASGLSMLMNAASKAIKNVIKHIDNGVIAPVIERYYIHNMLWNPDPNIKGDAQVVARGAMSLVAKEQNQMRLQELLAQTANPIDMQIIGLDGRAAMLRQAMQGVDIGADDAVPDREEIKQMLIQQQQQQQMLAQQQMPREADPAGNPMGGAR